MRIENKFNIQDLQYEFPYHYIPHFDKNGTPSLMRKLSWGFDYLCYQNHIKEKVLDLNPQSVLEVGCGDGYFIGSLPDSIPVRVGVDLSEKAITFAKAFHAEVHFYAQDVRFLKDKFDIVACIEVLEHVPDEMLSEFLCALCDRINNDGYIVISVPTTVIPLSEKHYRHYTLEVLKENIDQSQAALELVSDDYVYSRPWWFGIFRRFFDNRIFSLEVKPIMRLAWKRVWTNYRFAEEKNGHHLVAVFKKVSEE